MMALAFFKNLLTVMHHFLLSSLLETSQFFDIMTTAWVPISLCSPLLLSAVPPFTEKDSENNPSPPMTPNEGNIYKVRCLTMAMLYNVLESSKKTKFCNYFVKMLNTLHTQCYLQTVYNEKRNKHVNDQQLPSAAHHIWRRLLFRITWPGRPGQFTVNETCLEKRRRCLCYPRGALRLHVRPLFLGSRLTGSTLPE